jgi:acyl carrier protein
MSPLVGIALLVAGGLAAWLSQVTVKRRVVNRMKNRRARTTEEFGRDLFPPTIGLIATKAREILGRHLDIELSRVSPEDRFVEDLEMDELDSVAMVGFATDLEDEFGIKIPDSDAKRLRTFRDVVEYIAHSLNERRSTKK